MNQKLTGNYIDIDDQIDQEYQRKKKTLEDSVCPFFNIIFW